MPAVVPVSDKLAHKIGKYAQRVAETFDGQSSLVTPLTRSIPSVPDGELRIGKLLGRGGFNVVREVSIRSKPTVNYAIKHLRPEVLEKEDDFLTGATDLVAEARILNVLDHPNIISLHAVSNVPIQESYLDGGHYFLVLDRLKCSVEDKMNEWRATNDSNKSNQVELLDRVKTVAMPIAKALAYLHSKKIIFRDIKPANMGYAMDGTVKLFDFGLARELDTNGRRMTGSTGSRRYMAPEVALCEQYGLSADVYSFGVFLWELTSLIKPFDKMGRAEHLENVVFGNYRPELGPENGSSRIQRLIKRSWKTNRKQRPDFVEINKVLEGETNPNGPWKQPTASFRSFLRPKSKRLQGQSSQQNEGARAA